MTGIEDNFLLHRTIAAQLFIIDLQSMCYYLFRYSGIQKVEEQLLKSVLVSRQISDTGCVDVGSVM